MDFKGVCSLENGKIKLLDKSKLRERMDGFIYEAVFTEDAEKRTALFILLKELCKEAGAVPSSIQGLYEEMGRNYPGFTVPAMNIRGLTYDTAKAVFRQAMKKNVGAMIFEIARSEIGYTSQRPIEYATVILAAAVREGHEGPVFIQGDHFQLVRKNYLADPKPETDYVRGLVKEAIEAEFYNIDIDTSTIVDISKPTLEEQQHANYTESSNFATYIREVEPEGITVSIGGEIGEIGSKNSTPEELRAYLDGFKKTFKGKKGLSKLSVQTGTSHGGVVLPDGSLAKVKIDFETLAKLSEMARKEYGLSGCVQHGASTLPDEAFDMFPKTGTSEVHLATGFQNITFDSPALPASFRDDVYAFLKTEFAKERKEGQTDEQFIYSTRKKGFGKSLKKKWWDLPAEVRGKISSELQDKFGLLFHKLKVENSMDIVKKSVKPVKVSKPIPDSVKGLLG